MTTLAVAEQTLLRLVPGEGPLPDEVCERLERLLNELLWSLDSPEVPTTDGLILRREAAHSLGFWVLGKVYVLGAPHDEEPLWAEFAFTPARDGVVSGRILFAIRDEELGGVRRTRLDDTLLAYPSEVVATVPWRYQFARSVSGWTKVGG
jgi:hypothetical protein